MSEISLSGKKWIFKKFDNNYTDFLKDNFSLDYITAKLFGKIFIDPRDFF